MILHSIVPVEAMQQMMADWQAQGMQQPSRQTFFLSATYAVEGTVLDGQLTVERILLHQPRRFPGQRAVSDSSRLPFLAAKDLSLPLKNCALPLRAYIKKAGALWESLRQSLNRPFRQRFFLRCL